MLLKRILTSNDLELSPVLGEIGKIIYRYTDASHKRGRGVSRTGITV